MMKSQTKTDVKRRIVNAFGSLGYFFSFFAWFWALLLYFSLFKATITLVAPNANAPVIETPQVNVSLPSWLEMTIVIIVTTIMLAVTIYALVKLPSKIVKASSEVVHKTTAVAAPIIIKSQHKKDTQKNRMRLTPPLVFAFKIVLVVVPLIASLASKLLDKQSIDYTIAIIIAYGIAGLCVLFFAIQYALARAFRVKMTSLI